MTYAECLEESIQTICILGTKYPKEKKLVRLLCLVDLLRFQMKKDLPFMFGDRIENLEKPKKKT